MNVEMKQSLAWLCMSFRCQRLTRNNGIALFVKQGVSEMGQQKFH